MEEVSTLYLSSTGTSYATVEGDFTASDTSAIISLGMGSTPTAGMGVLLAEVVVTKN